MSIRSAAAAALCVGLPAVAVAQYPHPVRTAPPAPVSAVGKVDQIEWRRAGTARTPLEPPVVVRESGPPLGPPVVVRESSPLPAASVPQQDVFKSASPVTPAAARMSADPPATFPQPSVAQPRPVPVAAEPTPVVTQRAPMSARVNGAPDPTSSGMPVATGPTIAPPSYTDPLSQPLASCSTCDPACGPPGTVWGQFEWLFWAGSGQSLPPLVTGAPATTPRAAAGVLGQPTTLTTFGGGRANNDFRNGFRFTGGVWLNENQTFGLEADFLFLGRSREVGAAASNGSAVIARPFFNATRGVPAAELVSFPGVLAGSVTADATSTAIGGGVNALHNLCCDPCTGRVDLIYGFRYFHLADTVSVQEDLTSIGLASRVPPGSRFLVSDRFATTNDFYGGVIGLAGERRYGSFFVGGRASVALGGVVQTTTIDGTTTIITNGTAKTYPGGLLAQPTNIGQHRRTAFAVMPELGIRGGIQVTDHARVYAGYNFLYLSNVARAGDQIDPSVNTTLLPPRGTVTGPAVPAFPDRTTDFWLQGISVGVEFRY